MRDGRVRFAGLQLYGLFDFVLEVRKSNLTETQTEDRRTAMTSFNYRCTEKDLRQTATWVAPADYLW
jgi:hypothetical protein